MTLDRLLLSRLVALTLGGLLMVLVGPSVALAGATPLYSVDATGTEVRFGGTVGSGVGWVPQTPQAMARAGFAGRAALTCSGLDYGGFLQGFKASDFVNEIKNQFIGGAQAMVMTYLITTAYSNPTLASVIDMMNQGYSAKFNLFQSACNAQEAKQQGMVLGARRMAESQNQCYEHQVQNGASPTEAYQTCANEATFGSVASLLPAGQTTVDFLKHYTSIHFTREVETLLGLLPDERVTANGYEMRPRKLRCTTSTATSQTGRAMRSMWS